MAAAVLARRCSAGAPWAAPFLLRPRCGLGGGACRRGARRLLLRRSPVRVLPSLAEQQQQQQSRRRRPRGPSPPPPPPPPPPRPARKGPREEAPADPPEELRYERAFAGDKRLSHVVTVAKSKAFRQKQGKVLLEGRRLIADALAAGALPQTLFFSRTEQLKTLPAEKLRRAKILQVKFQELKAWSDVVAPQGLIGIFSRPDHSKMVYPKIPQQHQLPLALICDNIRDPGNLGTILRSAAGAGCSRVLLVKGCVDAWEPKVLRAGMGAHFRLPVIGDLEWEALPGYLLPETCVHVADSSPPAPEPEEEAEAEEPPSGSPSKASSYGWLSRPSNLKAQLSPSDLEALSESEEEEEEEEEDIDLEAQCYHEPWMDLPVAVVIGGETHGVSQEARALAHSTGGKRLHIPTVPEVNSLNSAMAASVLLFEAKRQLQLQTDRPSARRDPTPRFLLPP